MEQNPSTGRGIWLLRRGGERVPLADSAADESAPRFSPDGRWIAYVSNESGQAEVFARSSSATGTARRISTGGGVEPVWRRDGGALYYRAQNRLTAVPVLDPGSLRLGPPRVVFDSAAEPGTFDAAGYDAMPGTDRFVMIASAVAEFAADGTPGHRELGAGDAGPVGVLTLLRRFRTLHRRRCIAARAGPTADATALAMSSTVALGGIVVDHRLMVLEGDPGPGHAFHGQQCRPHWLDAALSGHAFDNERDGGRLSLTALFLRGLHRDRTQQHRDSRDPSSSCRHRGSPWVCQALTFATRYNTGRDGCSRRRCRAASRYAVLTPA